MEEQANEVQKLVIRLIEDYGLIDFGLKIIGALVTLILGWIVAKWVSGRVKSYLNRVPRIDNTLKPIFVKGTKFLILGITAMAVLDQFGIETTSILAILGTIGLAIGLALQGTLSNIASGIMLLVLRPFNVGDAVDIGGTSGVVDEIGLFVTYMHSHDNIAIVMPNSNVWGQKIKNYSRNSTRRAEMEFSIDYKDDMDKAMNIIKDTLAGDERVLTEPEPLVAINSLGDNAVVIIVRAWASTKDFWSFRYDFIKHIKERFDEEQITFPFPQRDLHLYHEDGSVNTKKG